jgi:hypothetical protein
MAALDGPSPSFESKTAALAGTVLLDGPLTRVFALFSPLGERAWVPGWNPEILAPPGAEWEPGMIFRTELDGIHAVWVVAELDREAHRVVYYRTEPGRLVARVEVRCRPVEHDHTEATVAYSYVGLSEEGNAHVAEWNGAAFASKMARWQESINACLQDTSI